MSKKILVETSARHIHISREDLDVLYGEGYELTNKKDLSQPGEFASAERLDVIGPKGAMSISILGPIRPKTQIELSLTDARSLGVVAKIKESGDTDGTSGIKLVGPKGEIEIKEGVLAAKRHVHMTPADAQEFGVTDKQIVEVKVETDERSLTFGDVICRVSDKYALAMHIDTDESNAAGISGPTCGEIIL